VIGYLCAWLELKTDRRAVAAIEYVVMAGPLAIIVFAASSAFASSLESTFDRIATQI
jgi:Flp pilus assembly pilin Flp